LSDEAFGLPGQMLHLGVGLIKSKKLVGAQDINQTVVGNRSF
jgi:hypothetical protein